MDERLGTPEKTVTLRQLRTERGLSQRELATFIGVTTQIIHKYEFGKTSPTLEHALAISRLFGVPVDLISFKSPEVISEQSDSFSKTVKKKQLLELFEKMTTSQREELVIYAKGFLHGARYASEIANERNGSDAVPTP